MQLSAVAFGHYRHVLSAVFEELVRSVYFDARQVMGAHAAADYEGAATTAKKALKVGQSARRSGQRSTPFTLFLTPHPCPGPAVF